MTLWIVISRRATGTRYAIPEREPVDAKPRDTETDLAPDYRDMPLRVGALGLQLTHLMFFSFLAWCSDPGDWGVGCMRHQGWGALLVDRTRRGLWPWKPTGRSWP